MSRSGYRSDSDDDSCFDRSKNSIINNYANRVALGEPVPSTVTDDDLVKQIEKRATAIKNRRRPLSSKNGYTQLLNSQFGRCPIPSFGNFKRCLEVAYSQNNEGGKIFANTLISFGNDLKEYGSIRGVKDKRSKLFLDRVIEKFSTSQDEFEIEKSDIKKKFMIDFCDALAEYENKKLLTLESPSPSPESASSSSSESPIPIVLDETPKPKRKRKHDDTSSQSSQSLWNASMPTLFAPIKNATSELKVSAEEKTEPMVRGSRVVQRSKHQKRQWAWHKPVHSTVSQESVGNDLSVDLSNPVKSKPSS